MTEAEQSYQQLLEPSDALIHDVARLDGDIMILGAGGKMGPALARLAQQVSVKTGLSKKIIAVSRFSEVGIESELSKEGIHTIKADLLEDSQLRQLPEVKNILYLAGTKFGTKGKESFTWAMNAYLPGRVAEKFKNSRLVVFSTGNVYPFSPVTGWGPIESNPVDPIGEYAQSCLGRERIFQYFSSKYNTPILIYRLNYANDVTYGVLLDIALAVKEQRPIDLRMGYANIIWQGEANELAIRCLHHCAVPPKVLNVTGPKISVRSAAEQFGKMMDRQPVFENNEQELALLSNPSTCWELFGKPSVTVDQMMKLVVQWINQGGKIINKPTHFQERTGQF